MLRSCPVTSGSATRSIKPNMAHKVQNAVIMFAEGKTTVDRILNAAVESIVVRGCDAINLRAIAEQAAVMLSQLCCHYGDKNNLFSAVLKRIQQNYMEGLSGLCRGYDTPGEQIIDFIDYNKFLLKESPDTYRIFIEFCRFSTASQKFQAELANFPSEIASMIESRIICNGFYRRSVAGFSIAVVARIVLSASLGIALQHFLSPEIEGVWKRFDDIKAAAVKLIEEGTDGPGKR